MEGVGWDPMWLEYGVSVCSEVWISKNVLELSLFENFKMTNVSSTLSTGMFGSWDFVAGTFFTRLRILDYYNYYFSRQFNYLTVKFFLSIK